MRHASYATASLYILLTTSAALAQSADNLDHGTPAADQDRPAPAADAAAPTPTATPSATPTAAPAIADEGEWKRYENAASESAHSAAVSAQAGDREPQEVNKRLLHGFRVGYNFVMNSKKREDGTLDVGPGSDQIDLKSPHSFVIGYEGFYRLVGHSWLNVLLVGNVSVAGLEQSTFIPSANGLIGFEFNESFQLGAGVNITPVKESLTHLVAAAGWTPKVGSFYVPLHFYFIPDKDGFHRTGATIGVTW